MLHVIDHRAGFFGPALETIMRRFHSFMLPAAMAALVLSMATLGSTLMLFELATAEQVAIAAGARLA